MNRVILRPLLIIILLAACSRTGSTGPVEVVLNIRAYIDGRTQLIIQGNTVYWHHFEFDAPGRQEYEPEDKPTYLNQEEWYPTWPDIPDRSNDFCDCASSIYQGVPYLAEREQRVWLDVVAGRERVAVVQQPTSENNFTMILEVDDRYSDGADWYDINLNYVVDDTQKTTSSSTVIPEVSAKIYSTASDTPSSALTGSISGKVLYDSVDPFLRVYAREVNTGSVVWVKPGENTPEYTITDLAPGTYVIVGWFHPMGASGAYTSLDTIVAEGETEMQACEGAIIYIELSSGEVYTGADIGCWGGDFFDLTE